MNNAQDELEFWRLASEVALHAHIKEKSISRETCDKVRAAYNAAQESFDETVSALMNGTYKEKSISRETCDKVRAAYNAAQESFDETVSALMNGIYKEEKHDAR